MVDSLYYAIDNDVAPIISMSYGICELGEGSNFAGDDAELELAGTEGITFMVSTGDQGAAACDSSFTSDPNNLAQNGLAVQFPASSANVTGVGGTGVPLTALGSTYWGTTNGADGGSALGPVPQQAWNDDAEIGLFCINNPTNGFCVNNGITDQQSAQAAIGLSGSGGGVSNCTAQNGSGVCTSGIARPTWQPAGLVAPAGQIGATKTRMVPDLSGLASPNFPGYIVCVPQSELGGGTTASTCTVGIQDAIETYQSLIGGTSASTPVTAGIVALLNQYLGGTGLGNINPTLYAIAPQVGPIVQITTGDNTMYCSPGTPVGQPAALQCPVTGVFGFSTANFDANTGYNMPTGLGILDVDLFAVAWANSRSSTATVLVPSSSSIYQGQPITLTATVTPGTATGSVSFLSGTTIVGTQAVGAGGVAVLTNPVLPIGTDPVTAQYNGDGFNMPSTSTPASSITVVAAFTLAAPDTAVTQGQATSPITITMTPAAGFTTALTYSCSLAAPETTCTVSPTTPTTSNPTVTVTTTLATPGGAYAVTVNATTGGANPITGSTTFQLNVLAGFTFTLSAPTSVNATQGVATSPVTITVIPASGTTNPGLTFTCMGSSGTVCIFNPNTLTTSNPTMTVTTPSATSFTLTVGATTGGTSPVTASTTLTVNVTAPAFTLSAPATTVTQGNSTGPITITAAPAAGFTTPLTYSCSLAAPETACMVSPPGPTTGNPAVTITTTAPSAQFHVKNESAGRILYALLLPGLFGIVLVGKSNRRDRKLITLGFLSVLATSTLWMSACASSSSMSKSGGTPKGMYAVSVNATTGGSNPITGSTQFMLTVQ